MPPKIAPQKIDYKDARRKSFSTFVQPDHKPTNYLESLMHLFKGNIGVGVFAMGDAFKNGGIYVSPVLTILMAVICVHCEHILLRCTSLISLHAHEEERRIDYSEAVELCFTHGPHRLAPVANAMGTLCTCFIVLTQLGFCCIYLAFISENLKQILETHGINIDIHLMLVIVWVPIWIACLITQLKTLAPVSIMANVLLLSSFIIVLYFALKDGLPSPSERRPYTTPFQLTLCLGTIIFCYEGIALVLPIQSVMKRPHDFERPLGVLNVGMFFVVSMYMLAGVCGYMKWGEEVGGTMTLNIGESILAQCTKGFVSLGIMFTYPLQFYVPVATLLPAIINKFKCANHRLSCELIFRTLLSAGTLIIALAFPNVGIFISFIGALCSTVLALVFPPIMEMLTMHLRRDPEWLKILKITKNCFILVIAGIGFFVGTYASINQIVEFFQK